MTRLQSTPTANLIKSYLRVTLLRGASESVVRDTLEWWDSLNVQLPSRHFLQTSAPDNQSAAGLGLLTCKPPRLGSSNTSVLRKDDRQRAQIREVVRAAAGASFPGYRVQVSLIWSTSNLSEEDWKHRVCIREFNNGVILNGRPWKAGQWGIVPGAYIEFDSSPGMRRPSLFACRIQHFYQAIIPVTEEKVLLARVKPYPVTYTTPLTDQHTLYCGSDSTRVPPRQFIVFAHFKHMVHVVPCDGIDDVRKAIPIRGYSE